MKKALPAPPLPGPCTDDDSNDGFLDPSPELIEWARRGDMHPLIAQLRGDFPLDRNVRDFLADWLDGKIKRARGKPVRRPDKTFALDSDGRHLFIDKRDVKRLEIKRWIHENKAAHGKGVNEAAAKHFDMEIEPLINMMRRSSGAWKRSRST